MIAQERFDGLQAEHDRLVQTNLELEDHIEKLVSKLEAKE